MTDPYLAPIIRVTMARPGPPGESADSAQMTSIAARLTALEARAVRPVVPDLYYGPLTTLVGWGDGWSTVTMTQNLLYASRYDCTQDATFDAFGVEVTTAVASSTIRMGVYAAGSDGYPAALVMDMGTVDSSATGFRSFNPIDLDLTAGGYWIAGACSHAGVAVRAIASIAVPGMTAYLGIASPTTPSPVVSLYRTAALSGGFSSLPAPFGSATVDAYCVAFQVQAA